MQSTVEEAEAQMLDGFQRQCFAFVPMQTVGRDLVFSMPGSKSAEEVLVFKVPALEFTNTALFDLCDGEKTVFLRLERGENLTFRPEGTKFKGFTFKDLPIFPSLWTIRRGWHALKYFERDQDERFEALRF